MCTGIGIKANNGAIVYGRTLEFGVLVDSKILMIPRGYPLLGTAPSGQPGGLAWKSKYAAVGANALGEIAFLDGVNEKGLAGGLFYFSEYAQYQEVAGNEVAHAIAPWELMTWILTSCESVQEVRTELPKIKVSNAVFKAWDMVPPVHAIVHDTQGHSLVIEYVDGKLNLYDNPLRVFTNSPTFDWHTTNLKNYINLSPYNAGEKLWSGVKFQPLSNGSGMLGLPGDFTSPSRFVRAALFSQSLVHIQNEFDALDAAFHLLHLFDIPIGVVAERVQDSVRYELTQWTSVTDLHNKRFFFTTYSNPQIKMVDLMSMELDTSELSVIPMESVGTVEDITPRPGE